MLHDDLHNRAWGLVIYQLRKKTKSPDGDSEAVAGRIDPKLGPPPLVSMLELSTTKCDPIAPVNLGLESGNMSRQAASKPMRATKAASFGLPRWLERSLLISMVRGLVVGVPSPRRLDMRIPTASPMATEYRKPTMSKFMTSETRSRPENRT